MSNAAFMGGFILINDPSCPV